MRSIINGITHTFILALTIKLISHLIPEATLVNFLFVIMTAALTGSDFAISKLWIWFDSEEPTP